MADEPTVLTGDQVKAARYLALAHGLALEINTGMTLSRGRSPMQLARQAIGSPKRTKRGVLADLVAYIWAEVWPDWQPSASITKALTKG